MFRSQARGRQMTWEHFYLICFLAGLMLSTFSLLGGLGHFGGHMHLPPAVHVPISSTRQTNDLGTFLPDLFFGGADAEHVFTAGRTGPFRRTHASAPCRACSDLKHEADK